jgi:outer membrane protein assembly factor BamB
MRRLPSASLLVGGAAALFIGLGPAPLAAAAPVRASGSVAYQARMPAQVATWPQFHYNAANTGYNPLETTIGPGNAGSLHVLWTASTAGAGAGIGAVSIAGGGAFLGTLGDSTLRAWRATDGASLWNAVAGDGLESTPAVAGGRVFIESNSGTLYAFSATTGSVLWSKSIGGAVTSPVIVDGVVYAAGYFTMNAFDAASGTLLWSAALPCLVRSNPAASGGKVFVSTEVCGTRGPVRRNLVALDAATGIVLWSKPIGGVQLASPVIGGGLVYVCSEDGLFARGVVHGYLRWSKPTGCFQQGEDTLAPALAQGVLYAPLTGSRISAFSASTGALLWSAGGSGDDAAPAVANGVLYVPTGTGAIAAYDTSTHALLWTSPKDGFRQSSPAVVNGILYVGGDKGLYAFGP